MPTTDDTAPGPAPEPPLSTTDAARLRAVVDASRAAREAGRHPFASMVVDDDGTVLSETVNNSAGPGGDPTQHAELVAAAAAARRVASADRPGGPGGLAGATLYTSAEPCAMCAGAVYWTGIGRVVYALSEERLLALTGSHPGNPTLALPCREVFARGQREVVVLGPHLQDEAAEAHAGFWR